eukprot:TRINITY_DN14456_c0_g1_i1.p1 TRINITY_DN14456_c0_g1~~TRINITY_DN14456_c0_g1_i1.p1  ORF type:complete len:386 (-),score=64.90 TRINITY_DN14456_c0_g1_i1:23-1030(-)
MAKTASCCHTDPHPCGDDLFEWKDALISCAHCSDCFPCSDLQYGCNMESLPPDLSQRFVQLGRDATTEKFLRTAFEEAGSMVDLVKSCFAGAFRLCGLSLTSANALTTRGKLFVLSTAQARRLLMRNSDESEQERKGVLLDVGAGCGAVTQQLKPLFAVATATESSWPMQLRLRQNGISVVGGDSLQGLDANMSSSGVDLGPDGKVDCVALLNVLDRCSEPCSLLRQLRLRLRPGSGKLLLAVVLPFRPFVEVGRRKEAPKEKLPLPRDASWELSVHLLWRHVLQPLDFELEVLARVPYLSEGDRINPVYALDDAVFVLRRPLNDTPSQPRSWES